MAREICEPALENCTTISSIYDHIDTFVIFCMYFDGISWHEYLQTLWEVLYWRTRYFLGLGYCFHNFLQCSWEIWTSAEVATIRHALHLQKRSSTCHHATPLGSVNQKSLDIQHIPKSYVAVVESCRVDLGHRCSKGSRCSNASATSRMHRWAMEPRSRLNRTMPSSSFWTSMGWLWSIAPRGSQLLSMQYESKPWYPSVQTKVAAKLFSFSLEYIRYVIGTLPYFISEFIDYEQQQIAGTC